MFRYALLCVFFVSIAVSMARADTTLDQVPNAQKIGEGRLSFLFWDVYDATLYAPDGRWRFDKPFAISVSYLMELSKEEIAELSIEEIREQGYDNEDKLVKWRRDMENLFPDVGEGTILTGVRNAQGHAIFYRDGELLGVVRDKEFAARFFGMWLDETTTIPELRLELLGMEQ